MNTAPPAEGDPFPDVALTTPEGGTMRPSDLQGRIAVLFFYPKDDTPGCTSQARDFSALLPEFAGAGVSVLGISKDPPERHRKFIAKHELGVPLASDASEHGLSDALGIWVEKAMYGRTYMGMARTTYLLNGDGRIAKVWHKVKVAGHAAEVLAAARALAAE